MFRRYSSSKLRMGLLAAMLSAVVFVGSAWAQETGGPEVTQTKKSTLLTVIFGNIDPIFVVIGLLSIVGLTLIIQGFIKNRASVLIPEASTNMIRDMIQGKRFKELIEFTENDPSFISKALNPALKRAPSFSSMKEAMETAIGEQTAERFRSIEYLNIIGNLGPLLGLTGTVLGMIEAFNEMSNSHGAAGPDKLAGGISRALAHTFLGLFLAVPCLACFGILRTFVDKLTVRGALIAEELLLMVKPQEQAKPGTPAGGPRPPGAPGAAPGMPQPPGMRRPPAQPAPAPAPLP